MKKLGLVCVIVWVMLLAGCWKEVEVVDNELNNAGVTVMSTVYGDGQTRVTGEVDVPHEDFKLSITYDTGSLPLNKWRVTSNKNVGITVQTIGLPEGYQAHIEHVHADICLKSTEPQLDGISHDSMDDSDHRTPTKGFNISDTESYHTIFAIEGYNCQFYEIWGQTFGEYGYVSSSYERLTEKNIREMGGYAEKLAVVYDIVITSPDGAERVRSVYHDVLIPLTGDIETAMKNTFTGEIK